MPPRHTRGPRSRHTESTPLRLELADSLLVLGQIERRRKARNQSPRGTAGGV